MRYRHLGWVIALYLVSVLLWRFWIPNVTSFEAPGWDESDRAHDALLAFRALSHFNPFPLLGQLVFFQTWGPLFTLFAQIPLALFGSTAQSMTLVSFTGLIFASFGTFWFVRDRLGWPIACATCVFTFFWLVSAPPFGPYFIIMMLESWVIAGWIALAVAGAIADVNLLIAASWILFAAKYQYYPIFFATLALDLTWNGRAKLQSFAKKFFEPRSTKILSGVAALLILHILIMKIFGPIYGQPSWNQPRALRNPVLATFIIGTVLLFVRREVIYSTFVERAWEEKYIKWFFWPATVLMAFPWPNRWAGIMVTQTYQTAPHTYTFTEILSEYANEILISLQTPLASVVLISILFMALALGVVLRCFGRGVGRAQLTDKSKFDFKSLPLFVSLIFIIQVLILLFAVKNVQPRFAFAVFFSVPVGLFVYALSLTRGWVRILAAGSISCLLLAILVASPFFRPRSFFLSGLHEHTNQTYFDSTELYPLDQSLGPLVKPLYKDHAVKLAFVQPSAEWYWDRPMRLWPIEFELHEHIPMDDPLFYIEGSDVCAQAKQDKPDLILKSNGNKWETVTCAL